MNMIHRHFRRFIYILLFLFMIALISVRFRPDTNSDATFLEDLKADLSKSESIISYDKEDARVYALISKEGSLEYGDFFMVFDQNEKGSWERIYENDFSSRKPWKIRVADIDGDGVTEILTSVNKTTQFDQVDKNRMFIFNFDGEKLYKKWTGSQIAGVWNDFFVGDLVSIPGEELIFIEQTTDGKERISIYYWFDFGFFLLASSGSYQDIQEVSILGENRIQIIEKEQQKQEIITLRIQDGELIEINQGLYN